MDYESTTTPGRFFYHIASTSLSRLLLYNFYSGSVRVVHEVLTDIICFPVFSTEWQADVDAYVVHTNYNEYAIVIMSKQKTSGDKSTAVKLYSE